MIKKALNIRIAGQKQMIADINGFSFGSKKITFLFGESGIGKSIIAKAIYGLLNPEELQIRINEQDYRAYLENPFVKKIKENGFFVFQEPSSHLNPLIKLDLQIKEGSLGEQLDEQGILQYLWDGIDAQTICSILEVYPKPYRPSGGEKQRILLAMAFKKINSFLARNGQADTAIFIFDEPTGSLDNHYRNLFLDLLFQKFRQKPFTVLLITHDYSIISEIYRRHQALLDQIEFKELSRPELSRLQLNNFSAGEYLSWLSQLEQSASHKQPGQVDSHHPLLCLKNGFKVFGRTFRIFSDPEFKQEKELKIFPGQLIYLKAGSGVGKTTLAKLILGLIKAQNLDLDLGGIKLTEHTDQKIWRKEIWGKKVGMVFQHADEALNLQASVKESLEGLKNKNLRGPYLKAKLEELFDEGIDSAFLQKKVARLSGGQKQRLNLLRTLVLDLDLVILDEPLNGLDFSSIQKVLNWLQEKRKQNKALLLISHNEEIFEHLVDARHTYYLKAE